jgi:hypothetical protein
MAKPDTIIVDGHAFSWQRLCELRREQLEAWRLSQPEQPATGRYREPTLFAGLPGRGGR